MHRELKDIQDFRSFHEKTDCFTLTVTFVRGKVYIKLQDLVDWIEYEKMYWEPDIGNDIHKKMDLIDVFSAFSQSKTAP